MTRSRRLASSDEDSQKENQGSLAPASKTKTRAERNATGGRLGVADARVNHAHLASDEEDDKWEDGAVDETRGEPVVDEEDEEAGREDDDEDGDEQGSPNGHKRARINARGDSVPVKDEKPKITRPQLPRDKDGSGDISFAKSGPC